MVHWCPINAAHERSQALLGCWVAAHSVAVDPQREAGVGVAELIHHAAGIDAERDEDRGEGVAELVGGSTIHRKELGMPARYTATIEFSDSRGRKLGPYTFDLDWGRIMDRGWITTFGMHQLAEAVREARDLLKNRGDNNYIRAQITS